MKTILLTQERAQDVVPVLCHRKQVNADERGAALPLREKTAAAFGGSCAASKALVQYRKRWRSHMDTLSYRFWSLLPGRAVSPNPPPVALLRAVGFVRALMRPKSSAAMSLFFPALLSAAAAMGGVAVTVGGLPAAAFRDGEVSAEVELPVPAVTSRALVLSLTLEASPTNNAEVAVGDVTFGWDCGEWFVRGDGLREYFSAAPASASGMVTLSARVTLSTNGVPIGVAFQEAGGAAGIAAFADVSPEWFDGGASMTVTARGGAAGVSASAAFKEPGSLIIMR